MHPQLTTAPGRIDIHLAGERFASYETDATVPGFTALYASGLRSVTQPDPACGCAAWVCHGSVNGLAIAAAAPDGSAAGRIVSRSVLARRGSQSVGFLHECDWIAPGGECLLREARTARIARGTSSGALLDLQTILTASPDTPIVLGQADEALLCVRVATALGAGGQVRNSREEFGPKAIHGRQAAWCACIGVVNGETVGLAVLDHPGNPWHPTPWVCREDGLLSPSPFPWRSMELKTGQSLALRYRIVVHSGYVEAGWVQERLLDWLRE